MATQQSSPASRAAQGYPSKKRRFGDSRNPDDHSLAPPQSRLNDPTYGQACAFPGLEDGDGAGQSLFYGPAEDGLEYLRMVRSEARKVPNLLVASSQQYDERNNSHFENPATRNNQRESYYYEDGAYASISRGEGGDRSHVVSTMSTDLGTGNESSPQEVYTVSLLTRFDDLRQKLQSLDVSSSSTFAQHSFSNWRRSLTSLQPTPSMLSALQQHEVLLALAALESTLSLSSLTSHPYDVHRNLGAWAFSLLAACREVGDMDSEDVSIVRDLGKCAAGQLRRIRAFGMRITENEAIAEDMEQEEEEEEEEEKEEEEEEEEAEEGAEDMNDAEMEGRRRREGRNTSSPSSVGSPSTSMANAESFEEGRENGERRRQDLQLAQQRLLLSLEQTDGVNDPDPPHHDEHKSGTLDTDEEMEEGEVSDSAPDTVTTDQYSAKNSTRHQNSSFLLPASTQNDINLSEEESPQKNNKEEEKATVPQQREETKKEDHHGDSDSNDLNILALYETIVLIISHRYGQSDLLSSLTTW